MTGTRDIVCLVLLYATSYIIIAKADPWIDKLCERIPQHTTADPVQGDNGFKLSFVANDIPEGYRPGSTYQILISGSHKGQTFRGYMITAVSVDAKDETVTLGKFESLGESEARILDECKGREVVTHQSLSNVKDSVVLSWTAPPPGSGCITFKATVIEQANVWYKDDGTLSLSFCEEGQGDGTVTVNVPDCCACGYATYKMLFVNNWSRNTHPKDYPPHIYKALLHWSNVVGATHSKNYQIWDYGQYASEGVRQVCEFGYPNTVEKYLKDHSKDIRTVVKTTFMFDLAETREIRVTVDKTHQLLSFLTMMGPSPDWCTGVSSYNLCNKNCTWRGSHVIDLYPWDAGTDSGVSYMTPNSRTEPREKIAPITNTYPSHDDSPFHSTAPIQPVARLHVTRIYPHHDSDTCAEDDLGRVKSDTTSFVSTDQLAALMMEKIKKQKLLEKLKCETTSWSTWSTCSVTCGVGVKIRSRELTNSFIKASMCEVALSEKRGCVGVRETCGRAGKAAKTYRDQRGYLKPKSRKKNIRFDVDYHEAIDPADVCATTQWSQWSPCSVSCGVGAKERRRMYMQKAGQEQCRVALVEKKACVAKMLDCAKANMLKDYTVICMKKKDPGPCRGRFTLWYYDTNMRKCLAFTYRGCRGNDNRFTTHAMCHKLCATHMERVLNSNDEDESSKQMMMKMQKEFMLLKQEMTINEERRGNQAAMLQKQIMQIQLMIRQASGDSTKQEMLAKQLMSLKQEMTVKENMGAKQRRMEAAAIKAKEQAIQKLMMMEKQQVVERREEGEKKQMLMEKLKQMEMQKRKQMEMQKRKQMEMQKRKQMEMQKRKQMEMQKEIMRKEQLKKGSERRKLAGMDKQFLMEKQQRMEKQRLMNKQLQMEKELEMKKRLQMERQSQKDKQQSEILARLMKKKMRFSRKHKVLKRRKKKHLENKRTNGRKPDSPRKLGKANKKGQSKKKRKRKRRRRPEDCRTTRWSSWTPCSVTCGVGVISKQRQIKRPARPGGRKCPKRMMKLKKCKIANCPARRLNEAYLQRDAFPVNCKVTDWSPWSSCSVTCGKGQRTKERKVRVRPSNGGRQCPKKLLRRRLCRLPKCRRSQGRIKAAWFDNAWSPYDLPPSNTAVDCRMSNWTEWSPCTKTCGDDVIRERLRVTLQQPKNGGVACGPTIEREQCSLPICVSDPDHAEEEESEEGR